MRSLLHLFLVATFCLVTTVWSQPMLQPRGRSRKLVQPPSPIPRDLRLVKQRLSASVLRDYFALYPDERPSPGATVEECTNNYVKMITKAKPTVRNVRLTALSLCEELEQFGIPPDQRQSAKGRTQSAMNNDWMEQRRERATVRLEKMSESDEGANVKDKELQDKLRRARKAGVTYELAKGRLRIALQELDQAYDELKAALEEIRQHGITMDTRHARMLDEADPDHRPSPDQLQMVMQAASRLDAARAVALQIARDVAGTLALRVRGPTPGLGASRLAAAAFKASPLVP